MNGRPPEIPPHKLISSLRGNDLLPAIIFLPTRRKCDEAAIEVAGDKSQKGDQQKYLRRKELFETFASSTPEIRRHKHAKILVNDGIASHHAGHIPSWKLVIEKMMSAGLLNAIFATSTVAAGVDFPARTVVISNADTRGNDGWRPLMASELQQMTGRAGRRGKDNVGFAILAPGQFQKPQKIAELLKAPADPLESKFRATYTTLLNLLDAFGEFAHLREIAEKSYAFRDTGRTIDKLRKRSESMRHSLAKKIEESGLDLSVEDVIGFERLTSAERRLHENIPATRSDLRQRWLTDNVLPGRVVTQGRSGKRLFLVISLNGESVSTMRDDGQGRNFPISRVNRIYEKTYALNDDAIERSFFDVVEGTNPPITEPRLSFQRNAEDPSQVLAELIKRFTGGNAVAEAMLWDAAADAGDISRAVREIDALRARIWTPFENRARVLDHFGYIDFAAEKVIESGKWLADLRLDRPLLVGEVLKAGLVDDLPHASLAGMIAALAADSDRNYGDLYLSDELLASVTELEDIIYAVSSVEWKSGITPSEEINLSAAGAAEHWTKGSTWESLVRRTKAEEGDLVRLLSRTGEALMQIAHQDAAHPEAAKLARETADIMLRDPIR
ncbi:MAG: hypothetical protein H0V76_06825 [Blastocatellia bacterium]|nr:hypothetical protein [Blastocatellia bacterium]